MSGDGAPADRNELEGARVVTKDELAEQRARRALPQPNQRSLFAMGILKRDGDRLLRVDEPLAVAPPPTSAKLPAAEHAHCPRCKATFANAGCVATWRAHGGVSVGAAHARPVARRAQCTGSSQVRHRVPRAEAQEARGQGGAPGRRRSACVRALRAALRERDGARVARTCLQSGRR